MLDTRLNSVLKGYLGREKTSTLLIKTSVEQSNVVHIAAVVPSFLWKESKKENALWDLEATKRIQQK